MYTHLEGLPSSARRFFASAMARLMSYCLSGLRATTPSGLGTGLAATKSASAIRVAKRTKRREYMAGGGRRAISAKSEVSSTRKTKGATAGECDGEA